MSKRGRDEQNQGASKKQKLEISVSSESSDGPGDEISGSEEEIINLQLEMTKQLCQAIDEYMPQFKRNLGSEAARALRNKLISVNGSGAFEQQYQSNLMLAQAIADSWETVVFPTLTEADKLKLKGLEAIKAWNREIVEDEIKFKKSLFLLDDLNVEDSEDDSEMEDEPGRPPKIPKSEVTIEFCRAVPKIFVPDEVDDNIQQMQEALDEECEGLMDDPDGEPSEANLANLTIGFWEHCLSGVKESVKENDYREAFITMLALTVSMLKNDHWVAENPNPESASFVFNKVGEVWKTLLARPLVELGVEGPREAFVTWLQKKASDVQAEFTALPKFDWKLQ